MPQITTALQQPYTWSNRGYKGTGLPRAALKPHGELPTQKQMGSGIARNCLPAQCLCELLQDIWREKDAALANAASVPHTVLGDGGASVRARRMTA